LSPHDEIKTFLLSNTANPNLSIDVALTFARGMSHELRTVLSQWEAVVESLERMKADHRAGCATEWRYRAH
jgi:hypothetical protein